MYSEEFYQKKQEEFILTCLFLDRNDISLCLHNYIEIWIFRQNQRKEYASENTRPQS